ncbi:hypothetical protein [Microlunatus kandeliicorticis]|uniref:hypothetical protein n=1 Tax=Microlunatus kandeliicorticis TaxID=1759536 RepID=UPI001F25F5C1|nr:hypothetical protein [Microlunatus kandeliicorticis]
MPGPPSPARISLTIPAARPTPGALSTTTISKAGPRWASSESSVCRRVSRRPSVQTTAVVNDEAPDRWSGVPTWPGRAWCA